MNIIDLAERRKSARTQEPNKTMKHVWRSDHVCGERIAQVREMQGMSQEQLADRLGVSVMDIETFEKDIVTPTTEQLAALSIALDFPASFFCHPVPKWMFTADETSLRFH
jgi:transcriptional regulator with XRE-family HTH domain